MKSLERLLKAVNKEFGMCPTWQPLIVQATDDYQKIQRYLRADGEVERVVHRG